MSKRVFIIHGWDGFPENHWFPWLKKELETKGFNVIIPAMPNSEHPKIENWVPFLKETVGNVNEDTYLIGHSIGCQTIMRYLETLNEGESVGGVIFVAGFFNLVNLKTEEEKEIAKAWLETPIDNNKIRSKSGNFVAIFSDNDPYVALDNSELFENRLGAKIIVEHERGHFGDSDGIKELPVVLDELLRINSSFD